MAEKISEIRKQPGMSSAGKYPSNEIFCGPHGTFPITEGGKISVKRLRNALARAHFAKDPEAIKACVYRHAKGHLKTMSGKKINK